MSDDVKKTENVQELNQKRKKNLVGTVLSNKMNKTIVVAVEYNKLHKLYKKYVKRTKKFKVHDEKNECQVGDLVRIEETRPISKEKYMRLVEVVQKVK